MVMTSYNNFILHLRISHKKGAKHITKRGKQITVTKTGESQEKSTLFTWSEQELELLLNAIQHYMVVSDFAKKCRSSSQSSVKVSFDNLKF